MSATIESPLPWRKAAEQFVTNGLFRSRSTQFDVVATSGAVGSRLCASEVVDGVFQQRQRQLDRQQRGSIVVNGVGCSPSVSPSARRRNGLSSQFNRFCHQLQISVVPTAVPSCLRAERGRLLSQSSEALSAVSVQTAPVVAATPPPPSEPALDGGRPGDAAPLTWSFSAPVKGATATVVVGPGIPQDAGEDAASIPSVRCELVAGLVNECSVVEHLLVIDCRSFVAYNANHVRGALNISCADCISRKRLLTGRITIADLVSGSDDAKDRYQRAVDAVQTGNKNAVQVRRLPPVRFLSFFLRSLIKLQ